MGICLNIGCGLDAPQGWINIDISFMTDSGLGQNEKRNSPYHRIRQIFGNSRHQWMWDFESLSFVLKEHGFVQIHNCGYGDWGDDQFKVVEKKKGISTLLAWKRSNRPDFLNDYPIFYCLLRNRSIAAWSP